MKAATNNQPQKPGAGCPRERPADNRAQGTRTGTLQGRKYSGLQTKSGAAAACNHPAQITQANPVEVEKKSYSPAFLKP